jgi:hypothetical protein
LRGLLVDALRDLGLPDALEIHAPHEAEHSPTAPPAPAQLAAAPALLPMPPALPASATPPAYSVPPGITDRPRRPRFSPWRAS